MSSDQSHRSIYTKGYIDGQRSAGVEFTGFPMNNERFSSIHAGLSSIAKRVYEFVPMQEAWTASQIHAELCRQSGASRDMRVTSGCIDTLVKAGIVREPSGGAFIRTEIRQKQKQPIEQKEESPMPHVATKPEVKPAAKQEFNVITRMSELAGRVTAMSAQMKALVGEIESLALEIDEFQSARNAEMAQFEQFKKLIKTFG